LVSVAASGTLVLVAHQTKNGLSRVRGAAARAAEAIAALLAGREGRQSGDIHAPKEESHAINPA